MALLELTLDLVKIVHVELIVVPRLHDTLLLAFFEGRVISFLVVRRRGREGCVGGHDGSRSGGGRGL